MLNKRPRMTWFDREKEAIQDSLGRGEITNAEAKEQLKELQREFREEAREAAQDAFDYEMQNWGG